MTLQEFEQIVKEVPAEQLAAFLQRGQLLTARDGIDSQIRNAEKARDEAVLEFADQIETLKAQRAELQKQIDAL